MSTVSGLASKADKEKGSKPKFSSLNINNIFKDKSSENTKTVEPVKHGLQTLGKIGAGRRVPPPANLPSLKSETINKTSTSNVSSTVNTSVNTSSSGNSQGSWAKKDLQENTTSVNLSNVEQQQSSTTTTTFLTSSETNGQLTDSNNSSQSNVNVNNTSQSKTWNTTEQQQSNTQSQQQQQQIQTAIIDTSPSKSTTTNTSSFSQDFPTLDVSNVQKSNSEIYNGPSGPNLRPQTSGNWLNKQQHQGPINIQQQQQQQLNNSQPGNQPLNSGNYANGQSQQDDLDIQQQQRAYNTAQQGPGRNNNKSNGYNRQQQNYPQRFNNNNNGQFNQQQYQSNNQRQQYDNRNNRHQNRIREDMPERAKVAILSEKDIQGFDELLDDSKLEDWTKTKTQIDFNAKLNFSEDEDARSLNEYDEKEHRDDKAASNIIENKTSNTTTTTITSSSTTDDNQHSRYRRDYQNPKPHQSYNSSNKYERNTSTTNYPPPSQQQSMNKNNKNDNNNTQLDDEKRMKLKPDLANESKRRREDDERKYNNPQQQVETTTSNFNKPPNRNLDNNNEMMSSNNQPQQLHNQNTNYNNRQFQQSLPPRFQKLQNTNQSSYNRYESNRGNQPQSTTIDKDRKQQDDQNKRILNKPQTNWRNNRELSKSQEERSSVQQPASSQQSNDDKKEEHSTNIKKIITNETKTTTTDKQMYNEKVDLDLKSSNNSSSSNQLLIKKSDDKSNIIITKENVAGDNINNDLIENTSQLSISSEKNVKPAATSTVATVVPSSSTNKSLEKVKDEQKLSTVDKQHQKSSLNASQEGKHSQDQHQSYKNQRPDYDNNRSHYRQDDYRMNQRDYRNTRQPIDNRDKMNKNLNKKQHEYIDDYRGGNSRDYNAMNRGVGKYEMKRGGDDKYSSKIQPSHTHQKDISQQKSSNKNVYPDNKSTSRREKDHSDKELSNSQNDKNKLQRPSASTVNSKDRKSEQLKYPSTSNNPSSAKHDDSSNDKNRQQSRDIPNKPTNASQQQKVSSSNYERKSDHQVRNQQQRKTSQQDEAEKVAVTKSQEDDSKKSKENVDKSKSKNEDPKSELSSSLHYSDNKDKNEPSAVDFSSFNVNKPTNVSKVVGASRNMVSNLVGGDQSQISPSTDLNLKIASVKNVWESMPSMPSVLEINNEDTLDHRYDENKLRSPVRGVDQQGNAAGVHVLSTINSSNNNSNNSSSFAFANINMKPISNDDLKKTHQQLYPQHASNQMHHQSLGQHPVLISTSPPNLINHMNNLDNVRRVQNQQYQLSNMQRISSPSSNLIYNSQTQVAPGVPQNLPPPPHAPNASAANVNIYQQFANHMKNMPQNAQLMPQQFANHFAAQHILQRNQVIAPQPPQNVQFVQQVAPSSMSGPNPNSNPLQSGPPPHQQMQQFVQQPGQMNLLQQNHLASHLINNKQHVVQAAPNAFYQNPPQQSIQPNLNQFYQNIPPPLSNAQKHPAAQHPGLQQIPIQHHPGLQQVPSNQQLMYNNMQPPSNQQMQQFVQQPGQMNQNNQLAANANFDHNYRNQKRFI